MKTQRLDYIGVSTSTGLADEAIRRGGDRFQVTLLPEALDDYIGEDNPVRAVDVFVEELDLAGLGFGRAEPAETGRPSYHPAVLLKIYIYGYLNRIRPVAGWSGKRSAMSS